jgi:para-aminobenzoate synthetase/4-amino-4-deoxychorismate lyase
MATSINTNEVLLKDNGVWLHFTQPQRVIQVDALGDILPALREIEDLIKANDWHAAGFLSYEAAPAFDKAHQTRSNPDFPLLWFGLYPAPRIVTLPEPDSAKPVLTWSPTVDRDTYNSAIAQIKDHIAEGRTYQVNYTMRLRTDFRADPWNFFLHLARTQNNHAAYIETGRYVIGSASPELFFQLDGETITGRPMKGTVKRGRTTLEDQEQAQWLHESEKNRAENVMIVDMIRNDLGRIARVGSVHVPELFTVEKYRTLWQMTSTVQAKTSACASITGAPKVSTMRIISELETTPRKIYTGSIGYIAPNRKAKFNVAIRTALIDRTTQTAEYGVGGGIVWDSTSADEYAEALLKARVLTDETPQFSLLETMLWTPEEGFFLREKHIARLLDSASYFDFSISRRGEFLSPSHPKEIIETYLNEISSQFISPQRVRLLLNKHGEFSHEAKSFQPSEDHPPLKVSLAKEPIQSGNVFLYHKTTHREVYESALRSSGSETPKEQVEYGDVLLYNEHNELTEFTIGNLVVEMDGKLFTPPTSCGLLPGTFRAHLLETGQVEQKVIRVNELNDCTAILLINSVRKWQMVGLMSRVSHTYK